MAKFLFCQERMSAANTDRQMAIIANLRHALLRPRLILVHAHLLVLIFRVYLYIGPSISGYRTHHGTCRYLDI
jgi:hypothetical protein